MRKKAEEKPIGKEVIAGIIEELELLNAFQDPELGNPKIETKQLIIELTEKVISSLKTVLPGDVDESPVEAKPPQDIKTAKTPRDKKQQLTFNQLDPFIRQICDQFSSTTNTPGYKSQVADEVRYLVDTVKRIFLDSDALKRSRQFSFKMMPSELLQSEIVKYAAPVNAHEKTDKGSELVAEYRKQLIDFMLEVMISQTVNVRTKGLAESNVGVSNTFCDQLVVEEFKKEELARQQGIFTNHKIPDWGFKDIEGILKAIFGRQKSMQRGG